MSILIKGAKMPNSCRLCDFIQWSTQIGSWFCPLKQKVVSSRVLKGERRYSNCPLTEVPPHGRLIDASEMAIKFNCRDLDITTVKKLHEWLMEIPTVIESEE